MIFSYCVGLCFQKAQVGCHDGRVGAKVRHLDPNGTEMHFAALLQRTVCQWKQTLKRKRGLQRSSRCSNRESLSDLTALLPTLHELSDLCNIVLSFRCQYYKRFISLYVQVCKYKCFYSHV